MKRDWIQEGRGMKIYWKMGVAAAIVVWIAAGAAGCGPRSSSSANNPDEESRKISEAARKDHLIGHDPAGQPVYGVDEEGKPIYKRDK